MVMKCGVMNQMQYLIFAVNQTMAVHHHPWPAVRKQKKPECIGYLADYYYIDHVNQVSFDRANHFKIICHFKSFSVCA